jgi:hypothetical protein
MRRLKSPCFPCKLLLQLQHQHGTELELELQEAALLLRPQKVVVVVVVHRSELMVLVLGLQRLRSPWSGMLPWMLRKAVLENTLSLLLKAKSALFPRLLLFEWYGFICKLHRLCIFFFFRQKIPLHKASEKLLREFQYVHLIYAVYILKHATKRH